MSVLNASALAGIVLYQRWLSPLKGFRCAHAAFYGGESCSVAIARIIGEQGLGSPAITAQFAACRQAYGHLPVQMTGGARLRGVCCCGPLPIPFRCG
ncbi:membrane protein insertion efficiency factor YidD [Deinococcus marmoris]|uniref:membrane protein insertion efficiency factor YidD n=1 Tax=Deinococcus marmoris TaxID=249408 RepID=UPI0009E03478|nr:membrane protein insertion efficiency factor YidD [Deinococcus marmoris]